MGGGATLAKIPGSSVIQRTASIFNERRSYCTTHLHRSEAPDEESTMKTLRIHAVVTLIFLLQFEAIRSSESVEGAEDRKVIRCMVVGPIASLSWKN